MKFKHTPGPWHIEGPYSRDKKGWGDNIAVVADNNDCIVYYRSFADWKANARLIAAAPEMLEMLIKRYRLVLSIYNQFYGMIGYIDLDTNTIQCEIDNLIEKATGKKLEDILNESK